MNTTLTAPYNQEEVRSKRIAAGVTAITLSAVGVGWVGAHKFLLGYKTEGLISLLVSLTCIGMVVFNIIALIEGILYLTKSDEEFYQTYIAEKRGWF